MTHYTGTGPRFLHNIGESWAPKAQDSRDVKKLISGLEHLRFLLGRLEAGGGLLMVQQHVKQLLHLVIHLGGGLHAGTIPLQVRGSVIPYGQLTAALTAFVTHQHDGALLQVVAFDIARRSVHRRTSTPPGFVS